MGYILKQIRQLAVNLEARRESFYLHCNKPAAIEEVPELDGKVFLYAIAREAHGSSAEEVTIELTYDQLDPLIESLVRLRNYRSNGSEDRSGTAPAFDKILYLLISKIGRATVHDSVTVQPEWAAELRALYEQGRADGRRERE